MGWLNRNVPALGDDCINVPDWRGLAVTGGAVTLFAFIAGTTMPLILGGESRTHGHAVFAIALLLLSLLVVTFGWLRHHRLAQALVHGAGSVERGRSGTARDPLTGFLDHGSFAEYSAAMLQQADRCGKAMALLIVDLDHFKAIGDIAIADTAIRRIAERIDATMPTKALTARTSGDKFACAFLFDRQAPDTVDRIARQLADRLSQPMNIDGIQIDASVAIGVARSDLGVAGIDALIRCADIAVRAARIGGRNHYVWFDPSMERESQVRTELESDLRTAIVQRQIVPYFEQQIDLATGRIQGFEVLARWEHPQRGTIPPDTFIPIAEAAGLISEISVSIMEQAFAAARDWHSSLTLSVNISSYQLKDAWLAQKIIKALTESGFPASRLEIEITESALFHNLALAQSTVGSLKHQGIRLALDDFGTGYSSLAHLRALPFDRIKIDRSFVQSLNTDPESLTIVKSVVSLGESLNLPITAEGIEDEVIAERLFQLGCTRGQGYMFGRPLNIAQVRRLLAERRLLAGHQTEPTSEDNRQRLAG